MKCILLIVLLVLVGCVSTTKICSFHVMSNSINCTTYSHNLFSKIAIETLNETVIVKQLDNGSMNVSGNMQNYSIECINDENTDEITCDLSVTYNSGKVYWIS